MTSFPTHYQFKLLHSSWTFQSVPWHFIDQGRRKFSPGRRGSQEMWQFLIRCEVMGSMPEAQVHLRCLLQWGKKIFLYLAFHKDIRFANIWGLFEDKGCKCIRRTLKWAPAVVQTKIVTEGDKQIFQMTFPALVFPILACKTYPARPHFHGSECK